MIANKQAEPIKTSAYMISLVSARIANGKRTFFQDFYFFFNSKFRS